MKTVTAEKEAKILEASTSIIQALMKTVTAEKEAKILEAPTSIIQALMKTVTAEKEAKILKASTSIIGNFMNMVRKDQKQKFIFINGLSKRYLSLLLLAVSTFVCIYHESLEIERPLRFLKRAEITRGGGTRIQRSMLPCKP